MLELLILTKKHLRATRHVSNFTALLGTCENLPRETLTSGP